MNQYYEQAWLDLDCFKVPQFVSSGFCSFFVTCLIKCYLERFASVNDPENWTTLCSLMALAIWVHFRSSNFRHVTDNWELTVKIFTLKWGKDNERATSSFRYILEAIRRVLINSPCMCVYVVQESVNKAKRVTWLIN